MCHFIVWSPNQHRDDPTAKESLEVIHVKKDPSYEKELEDARTFYFERLLPYVLSDQYEDEKRKHEENRRKEQRKEDRIAPDIDL